MTSSHAEPERKKGTNKKISEREEGEKGLYVAIQNEMERVHTTRVHLGERRLVYSLSPLTS